MIRLKSQSELQSLHGLCNGLCDVIRYGSGSVLDDYSQQTGCIYLVLPVLLFRWCIQKCLALQETFVVLIIVVQ